MTLSAEVRHLVVTGLVGVAAMRETANDLAAASPRCVRRSEIERDYGIKPAVFSRLVKTGVMPQRIPGTRLWDRRDIDHKLDKLAHLDHPANKTEADRYFEENGYARAA